MLLFFSIWLLMLIFSLAAGARHSHLCQVKAVINFTRRGHYNYTLGLHHTAFMGYNKANGEMYRVEIVYIGLLLVTIEADFYKVIANGPADMNTYHAAQPEDIHAN